VNQEEIQKSLMEFERSRGQLMQVSQQKQQMQFQLSVVKKTLEELNTTEEKKVYQAIGNIMILKDVKAVKKDLQEQKETLDVRVKTVQKQEDALIDKLNKLKADIEAAAPQIKQAMEATEPKEAEEEKKEEKKK
jgi:prefoldin beta subunit